MKETYTLNNGNKVIATGSLDALFAKYTAMCERGYTALSIVSHCGSTATKVLPR